MINNSKEKWTLKTAASKTSIALFLLLFKPGLHVMQNHCLSDPNRRAGFLANQALSASQTLGYNQAPMASQKLQERPIPDSWGDEAVPFVIEASDIHCHPKAVGCEQISKLCCTIARQKVIQATQT